MLTHTAIRTGFNRAANNPSPRAPGSSFFDSISLMGATMPYGRDAEIYGENEPADYVYRVISGAVRTYKVLGDGRRQVAFFYLPGDIFGLETGDEHTFSAEAISDAKKRLESRYGEVPCWHWRSARARQPANCGR